MQTKKSQKYSEVRKSWKVLKNTWFKIVPPSRPCKDLLSIWEDVLVKIEKRTKNPKGLILGSTPELRDLLIKNGFQSFACDVNANMLMNMDGLMKYGKSSKNKKIVGNWLKVNLPQNSFDVVVGHIALEQILNVKDLNALLGKIQRILKPNGVFLTCCLVRNKKPVIIGNGWEKLLRSYKNKKISEIEFFNFLKYNSDWNAYKKSPSVVGHIAIYERLEKMAADDSDIKKFCEWWKDVLGEKDKPVSIFTKKDLVRLLKKYFSLKEIKQCREYEYCSYLESYLGTPRKDV
ncbi:MAG: methyltransferase domain-containing protein [Candidatus Staskawiczbacteria bacterium]|jgi:ubiquinone/menaquinone biosynthesis C-methylase UbiE